MTITTINEMKNLPCALPCSHPNYRHPTPEEVAALINLMGWSQREVALIIGVSYGEKGSNTVRRWKTKKTSKEYREVPSGTWQYLLEYAGFNSVKETREVLKKYHHFP